MASDESTVRVPLTVEERAERADVMAGLLAEIAALERQKAEKAKELGDAIKALEARLQEHGNVLREGSEERAQMDLTFPQEQAAAALAAVGAAACTCEGGTEADVHDPACPLHGVDAKPPKVSAACDGDHEEPACADPECWLRLPDVDDSESPPGAQVDVGTVEEPRAVADFREAKAKRAQA